MEWILERLSEASTWRGIVSLATACGITLSPDLQNQIIAVGLGLIGLINVAKRDYKTKQEEKK